MVNNINTDPSLLVLNFIEGSDNKYLADVYSNTNVHVEYSDILKREITDPLGMTRTGFQYSEN